MLTVKLQQESMNFWPRQTFREQIELNSNGWSSHVPVRPVLALVLPFSFLFSKFVVFLEGYQPCETLFDDQRGFGVPGSSQAPSCKTPLLGTSLFPF
jgi:hypothetical protein